MMQEYFAEEGFRGFMRGVVEPYLKKYQKKGYFNSFDGAPLFYYTYCQSDAKAALVISHGFCEFAEKYQELIYYFLQEGYSVYLLEHRGHGYSKRETGDVQKVHITHFEDYIRDFACFVEHIVGNREESKVLFAHSMGGAIAVRYLEEYPDVFDGAILSAPMLKLQTGVYPEKIAELIAAYFTATGRGERYAAGQGGFDDTPDFAGSSCISKERYCYVYGKRKKDLQYQTYGATYRWLFEALKATGSLRKRRNLDQIKIPILLFEAGRDHMVGNAAIEQAAERIAEAKLIRMEHSKHEIFNADEKTRSSYYETIFKFITQLQEQKEEDQYEEKIRETRKILDTL